MNKFSNINWAALLLGGAWGSYNNFKQWTYLWVAAAAVIYLAAFIGSSFMFLGAYTFMAATAVYLALQGNDMLSKEIQKKELSLEEEQKERATASARQQKLLIYGVLFRPFVYYFTLGFVPARFLMSHHLVMTDHFMISSHIFFAMLAVDGLALTIALCLAFKRCSEENELYSGDAVDADLIVAAPMTYLTDEQKRAEHERKIRKRKEDAEKQHQAAIRRKCQLEKREYVKGDVQAAFDLEDDN